MEKALVLISGGLDSTTCLAYAKAQGFECHALTINYGQRHESEIKAAEKITQFFEVKSHRIFNFPIGQFGGSDFIFKGSALTDANIDVPEYQGDEKIPSTYVPARNTIFLSIALGYAEVLKADAIVAGMCAKDYSGYPDCRPEYIEAFQNLANLATKEAIEGRPVKIITPLLHLTKAETIQLGISLGVDYSITVSCYNATPEGKACGRCDSCHYRKTGFQEAKITDPTLYI